MGRFLFPPLFEQVQMLQNITQTLLEIIALSGWGDSNSRPLRPERSALTGLRYIPNKCQKYHISF